MKLVKIGKWERGIVFKNENYNRILIEGTYWIGFTEQVIVYKMSESFVPPCDLNILLNDSRFRDEIHLVEISDNEIGLRFEDDNLKSVILPGKYAFWKGLINHRFEIFNANSTEVISGIDKSLLMKRELLEYIRVFNVESFENGLLMIDGKLAAELNPGTYFFWKNATPISVLKADMRQLQIEISGQEILTKDKAALRINFYAQYKIDSVKKVLLDNKDFEKQLYFLLQLALRSYIGSVSLDELLEKKESMNEFITNLVKTKATEIGVTLLNCGIRDIILPGEMKDILNQVLIAEKKAQANTIMRREETASTRSLLNTAKMMEENAMLFKLKEMEYVEKIADKINSISVSGGSLIVDQLKQIFVPEK